MSSPSNITGQKRPLLAGRRIVWRWLALTALLGSLWFGVADELPAGKLENQVKAAFLIKFASFIEWPAGEGADTNAPFVIGLLGRDPFGQEFDEAVKAERVKDRPVELRRASDLGKLADCPVVYVASSELNRLEEIVAALEGRPVLLVTDGPGAALRGSQINFIKTDGKVRFEINLAAAERARLKFSAKLLQVGRIVGSSPPAEGRKP